MEQEVDKNIALKVFPENTKFKYSWRRYQKKVLDSLQNHLVDGHLHIIAPPGSGKTILGLEVALRLNQLTLILAPTIAIRNQWVQKFCKLSFLMQSAEIKPWSLFLRNNGQHWLDPANLFLRELLKGGN